MNTSITELEAALEQLVSSKNDSTGLETASKIAKQIADNFSGVNNTLVEGWQVTSDFSNKIHQVVKELCTQLYTDVHSFTEEMYQAEMTMKNAVDKANETASNILKELGIDSSSV